MAGIDARALYGYSDANVKILPSNQALILAGEPAGNAREETPFSSRPLGWSREYRPQARHHPVYAPRFDRGRASGLFFRP